MEDHVIGRGESASTIRSVKGKSREAPDSDIDSQSISSPHLQGERWYLHHLNRQTEFLRRHRHGAVNEGGGALEDRKDGEDNTNLAVSPCNLIWTVEEKEVFFGSLARHSRLRPDLIAAEVRTKTETQVIWYLDTLEAMSLSLRHDHLPSQYRLHLRPWLDGIAPPAREVSDGFIAREEELAKRLSNREIEWSRHAIEATHDIQTKQAVDRQKGAWRIKKPKNGELQRAVLTPLLQEELKRQKEEVLEVERRWFVEDFLACMNPEKMKFMSRRFDALQRDELRQHASQALAEARARLGPASQMAATQPSEEQAMNAPAGPSAATQAAPSSQIRPRSSQLHTGSSQIAPTDVMDDEMLVAYEDWRLTISSLRSVQRNQLEREWHEEQRLAKLSEKEKWFYTAEDKAEHDILVKNVNGRTKQRRQVANNKGIEFGETATGSQLKLLLLLHRREKKAIKEAEEIPIHPPTHTRIRKPAPIVKAIRAVNEDAVEVIAEHREAWKEEIAKADKIIEEWSTGHVITGAEVFKQYNAAVERAVVLGIDLFEPANLSKLMASDTDIKCLNADVLRWLREELKLYLKRTMLRAISLKEQDMLRQPDIRNSGPPFNEIQSSHVWRASGVTLHSISAQEAAEAYATPETNPATKSAKAPIGLDAWLACPESMDTTHWTPFISTRQELHSQDLSDPAVRNQNSDAIMPQGKLEDELAEDYDDYIADEDWRDEKDYAELDDLQNVIDETEDKEYEAALTASLLKDEGADDTPMLTFDWNCFDRIKKDEASASSRATTADLEEADGKDDDDDEGGKQADHFDDEMTEDDDKTDEDGKSDDGNDEVAAGNDLDELMGEAELKARNRIWLVETKQDHITKLYRLSRRRWKQDFRGKEKRYRKPARMREPRGFRSAAIVASDDDESMGRSSGVQDPLAGEMDYDMSDTESEY